MQQQSSTEQTEPEPSFTIHDKRGEARTLAVDAILLSISRESQQRIRRHRILTCLCVATTATLLLAFVRYGLNAGWLMMWTAGGGWLVGWLELFATRRERAAARQFAALGDPRAAGVLVDALALGSDRGRDSATTSITTAT